MAKYGRYICDILLAQEILLNDNLLKAWYSGHVDIYSYSNPKVYRVEFFNYYPRVVYLPIKLGKSKVIVKVLR